MLAKKYRLPIQTVLGKKATTSINGGIFLLKIFPTILPYNRYGVVVSKKVDKRAVYRNQIRRMFLDSSSAFTANTPYHDFLFIIQPSVKNFKKPEISVRLKEIFKHLKHLYE